MTKLPDDVVREIEKAFTEKYCVPKYSANDGWKMYLEGAEFGFKLSQAKSMKLVDELEFLRKYHDRVNCGCDESVGFICDYCHICMSIDKALAEYRGTPTREDEG